MKELLKKLTDLDGIAGYADEVREVIENEIKDHVDEMFTDPRVLGVVSGLLVTMGIIPGMPTVPFLLIAAVAGGMAFLKTKEKTENIRTEEARKLEQEQQKTPH